MFVLIYMWKQSLVELKYEPQKIYQIEIDT